MLYEVITREILGSRTPKSPATFRQWLGEGSRPGFDEPMLGLCRAQLLILLVDGVSCMLPQACPP